MRRGTRFIGAAVVLGALAACATSNGQAPARAVAAVKSPIASATPSPRPTSTDGPTYNKTCPPVGDHSSWPVTLPKPARQIGKTVKADVDGDGRLDAVRLMGGWRTEWDGDSDELTVNFARGGRASVQIDALDELTTILGVADVNADGRAEIVVLLPGNTAAGADVVTSVNHRLMVATTCMYDSIDGWYRQTPVGFWAHGNACYPWCDETTACRYVDGAQRLITTEGRSTTKPSSPEVIIRKEWTVTVYRLVGADFVRTATYHGSVRGEGPLPTKWPFLDALSCGTATYPDGF